jgi:hypothetical protein
MKLQRTTVILLVSATLLGTVVYLSEVQRAEMQEAPKTTKQPIFYFKEDQIQSVTIYQGEETLEFERVSGQISNWQMKQPKDAPASDAAVAFLLNLLTEGKSDRSFPIQGKQFPEYGLDKPMATVKVQLKNNEVHWLNLGKPDFNRSFLYAQADPKPPTASQPLKVLLVPIDFEYAVNRPMSEWQSKAAKPMSPTPSPTTASPQPSPTSAKPQPSPTAASPQPSQTPAQSKPSPTAATPKPSQTPAKPQPSPASGSPKPSATPAQSKPSPTAATPKPSATPAQSKPSPTAATPKPSATPAQSKPSPASGSPKPSATPAQSKPSPASGSLKPSPTPASPKPSPTAATPKPSPTPAKPKPSPTEQREL